MTSQAWSLCSSPKKMHSSSDPCLWSLPGLCCEYASACPYTLWILTLSCWLSLLAPCGLAWQTEPLLDPGYHGSKPALLTCASPTPLLVWSLSCQVGCFPQLPTHHSYSCCSLPPSPAWSITPFAERLAVFKGWKPYPAVCRQTVPTVNYPSLKICGFLQSEFV